jgi:hypothetical protein
VINARFIRGGTRIMSFSNDKVLRIWSVELQMLIYKIENIFPNGVERKIYFFC